MLPEKYVYNWNDENEEWVIRHRIGKQTVELTFQGDAQDSGDLHWNIALVCYNKRKNIDKYMASPHTTGENGIENLLFAKNAIWSFEELLRDEYPDRGHILSCSWLDNRRRNVYYRGLRPLGYEFGMLYGHKVLMKKLDFS